MEQLVTSDFKLGIISGGQLCKMIVLAASNWDIKHLFLIRIKIVPLQLAIAGERMQIPSVNIVNTEHKRGSGWEEV